MALALNNLKRVDMPLNKETKPKLGSNDNEAVLRIPQASSITEVSPLDSLVSYPGHSLG